MTELLLGNLRACTGKLCAVKMWASFICFKDVITFFLTSLLQIEYGAVTFAPKRRQ